MEHRRTHAVAAALNGDHARFSGEPSRVYQRTAQVVSTVGRRF
ncbi:hypothetical protein Rhow_008686 [Rhodococcus wratislaviensis]|uniref:Uncharacterized protein n=1 Tax=Rhodococcus wratislaviensis TaxID=44752 RepID=A0A402CL46_RHOWR|nr:hypothetical protein Rhow_008686 [Rhodococcus wratislaviensis]